MDLENENIDPVEIWGGAEYSFVRVKNGIYDQLAISGHEYRLDDLNLFSKLKINTIRYPLLWEKYAENPDNFYKTNDLRLEKLRELHIKPIAGLLHHGSGPFFTDLYDENFPDLLAGYAYNIAQRYPWIENYTPINEPLTTARFSGLYGIWYPHKKDDYSFIRILINELKGIILSMSAIRSINPDARLIQTEDICRISGSNELQYQADFENQRRWITYDLLLGKVDTTHPLWKYLVSRGIKEQELEFFLNSRIIPSICGFNYYVTSDRYLDHRKSIYPSCFHGGNGIQEYADVEAVRANIPVKIDPGALFTEAWERYKLPLALTEVHLACTREEQLRWFYEAYQTAGRLKAGGVDFRAITAWSFFGSFDWSSLLCEKNNSYESGVFDIKSGVPRATALAGLIKSLNEGSHKAGSLLEIPGWWRRSNRFIYKAENERNNLSGESERDCSEVAPLLITGAKGSLGSALARICESRGIIYYLSDRGELDIASEESVKKFMDDKKPWGVINAAGFTRINDAEKSSFTCFRENTVGPGILAEICKLKGIKFVTFSTDQVFDGKKRKPYTVSDKTQPLNLYGLSKRMAEEKVMKINPDSLIIRSSSFFNPWHRNDNLIRILQSGASSDRRFYLASDIVISPTYIPDLVNAALDLMIDGECGIWHLSSQEEITHYDFARLALQQAGLNEKIISPVPAAKLEYPAARPSYSVLRSSWGITLPQLSNSLNCFLNEYFKEPSFRIMHQLSF